MEKGAQPERNTGGQLNVIRHSIQKELGGMIPSLKTNVTDFEMWYKD